VLGFEWAAVVYCVYIAAVACVLPRLPARSRAAIVAGVIAIAGLASWSPHAPWRNDFALRYWILPAGAYLLGGYYLSGLLYVAPMPRLERRLAALDASLGAARWSERFPLLVLELVEFCYLSVSGMVVFGALAAYAWGGLSEASYYWRIVLTADLVCFACMPFAQTRTPRAVEGEPRDRRSLVRRLNVAVLGSFSHERNTFPSGHAAEALAVLLALAHIAPFASIVLVPVALAVPVGSIAGRYHFAGDAIAGYFVAIVVWILLG
jgi:membrane-associated phospholipid phosphatase